MQEAWAIREVNDEVIKISKQLGVKNIIHYGGPGMTKHYEPPLDNYNSYKNLVTAKEIDMQCVLVKGGGLTAHEESVDREKEKILDLIVTTLSDVEDQNKIIDLYSLQCDAFLLFQ